MALVILFGLICLGYVIYIAIDSRSIEVTLIHAIIAFFATLLIGGVVVCIAESAVNSYAEKHNAYVDTEYKINSVEIEVDDNGSVSYIIFYTEDEELKTETVYYPIKTDGESVYVVREYQLTEFQKWFSLGCRKTFCYLTEEDMIPN